MVHPAISSINLTAALGSLATIARQRPMFMAEVIQAYETLHGKRGGGGKGGGWGGTANVPVVDSVGGPRGRLRRGWGPGVHMDISVGCPHGQLHWGWGPGVPKATSIGVGVRVSSIGVGVWVSP